MAFGGGALGALLFSNVSAADFSVIEGLAAGAMLTMIAQTMLPEAYIKGGNVVGLATLMGFLVALFFKELGCGRRLSGRSTPLRGAPTTNTTPSRSARRRTPARCLSAHPTRRPGCPSRRHRARG